MNRRNLLVIYRALSALALGGVIGLTAWWMLRRRCGWWSRGGWLRIAAEGAIAFALGLLLVGAAARTAAEIQPVAACARPGAAYGSAARAPLAVTAMDGRMAAEKAATWAPAGLSLLYARMRGEEVCLFPLGNFYEVSQDHRLFGRTGVFVGDVLLLRPFQGTGDDVLKLAGHEVRHRSQWALTTFLGGPLGFPLAYTLDNLFFPGSNNHFERAAGLTDGNYPESASAEPVGGARNLLVLLPAMVIVGLAAAAARHASTPPFTDGPDGGIAGPRPGGPRSRPTPSPRALPLEVGASIGHTREPPATAFEDNPPATKAA